MAWKHLSTILAGHMRPSSSLTSRARIPTLTEGPALAHHDLALAIWRVPPEVWLMIGQYDCSPQQLSSLVRTCKLLSRIFMPVLYRALSSEVHLELDWRWSQTSRAAVLFFDTEPHRTFKHLLRTLTTSSYISYVHEFALDIDVSRWDPAESYAGVSGFFRRGRRAHSERQFSLQRRDILNMVSTVLPGILKAFASADSVLSSLSLSSNMFDQYLGMHLVNAGPFENLKTLKLECKRLSAKGLADLCKFVCRLSLERLSFYIWLEELWPIEEAPLQRSFDLACSYLRGLSLSSPNMQVFDFHFSVNSEFLEDGYGRPQDGIPELESALNELRFPVVRKLHVRIRRYTRFDVRTTNLPLLLDAHRKLLGEAEVIFECSEPGRYYAPV